jgi:hypothetical protein
MRTIPAAAQEILSQNLGVEGIILVEVEWVDGTPLLYSDQEVTGAKDIVVDVDGLDVSQKLEGSGDSNSVTVTLDDIDGELRGMYEATNSHMKTARLYLLPKGAAVSAKILLFDGVMVTPIQWPEGERLVTFNFLTKLTSINIGFSMEEGDFPNIPEEALGEAWPLVFGQVCWVPAVRVRAPRRGYMLRGEMIPDFTLDVRICQALKIQCPSQNTGETSTMVGSEYVKTDTVGPDQDCVNRRFGEICKLRDLKTQQQAWVNGTIPIQNGDRFPQNQKVTLYADGGVFWGTFSGNTFTITAREHKDYADWNHATCRDIDDPVFSSKRTAYYVPDQCGMRGYSIRQGGYVGSGVSNCFEFGDTKYAWGPTDDSQVAFSSRANADQEFESCDEALTSGRAPTGGPRDSWEFYDNMEEAGYQWIPSGTEVYIEDEKEELHIVSLINGDVDEVAAFRTAANGQRYLTEVPASYYTVYKTNYVGYTVVEIGFEKSLSLFDDGWEDQIYVSFTSSVGPNTADIIEWILEKYTNVTVDATSFAAVKAKIANYPHNIFELDRPDALQYCADLAYQARCSLTLRNGVAYLSYLSDEPSSVRTLTNSDILQGTFLEYLSETDEVYTNHQIEWTKAGAAVRADLKTDRKLILKYNMDVFGNNEQTWQYNYNIYSLVLKSGTFWLIRKANSWRRVEFSLPMKHIDLDAGDCVTLNCDYFPNTKAIVEKVSYRPESDTVDIDCWTPIRAGETSEYYWAWPAQKPAVQRFPLPGDTHGGGGYTFNVTPPTGHILLGGSDSEDQVIISTGDRNPSDLDDTFPTVDCEILNYINFNEVEPAIEAKEIAQSAARSSYETTMGGGGNPGGNTKKRKSQDECGQVAGGCGYKVIVRWHTSRLQGHPTSPSVECGGPCSCRTGDPGCPSCVGSTWEVCHTWTSSGSGSAFASYMEDQYGKSLQDKWDCNETAVIKSFMYSTPVNNSPDGQCPGGSGEQVGTPQGTTGREQGAGQEDGGDNTDLGEPDGEEKTQTSIQPD